MDKGEDDHADAFDADNDVAVLGDAADVAFVALVDAAGDADAFARLEVAGVVDAAPGGVVGGEQPKQVDGLLRDDLDGVVAGVAVDPDGRGQAGGLSALGFEGQRFRAGGADKEDVWDYGLDPGLAAGDCDLLLGEEDLVTDFGQVLFGLEVVLRPDGEPHCWIGMIVLAHVCIHFIFLRATAKP